MDSSNFVPAVLLSEMAEPVPRPLALLTLTVPPLIVVLPVKAFDPESVSVPNDASSVISAVPEMTPVSAAVKAIVNEEDPAVVNWWT